MATLTHSIEVSCAVEVFVATALLHKELPDRTDFSIQEIVNRASVENLSGEYRPGIHVHASQHCVANRVPNPSKHRMLFATGKHTRRLLLPGDEVHPARTGKIFPDEHEIPPLYLPLLAWAKARYQSLRSEQHENREDLDARIRDIRHGGGDTAITVPIELARPRFLEELLSARGIGAEMAKGIDPDEYIRELREGWE